MPDPAIAGASGSPVRAGWVEAAFVSIVVGGVGQKEARRMRRTIIRSRAMVSQEIVPLDEKRIETVSI